MGRRKDSSRGRSRIGASSSLFECRTKKIQNVKKQKKKNY